MKESRCLQTTNVTETMVGQAAGGPRPAILAHENVSGASDDEMWGGSRKCFENMCHRVS